MHAPSDPVVGIDLGTTNSLVAICDLHGPRVLPDGQGRPLLPSVVRFEEGSAAIVGHEAKDLAAEHPLVTVASVKRLMGRSRADAAADLPYLSCEVVEGEHNTARIAIPLPGGGRRIVSPQEVSAVILRTLKDRASRALGTDVRRAVITVPAYFDDAQRQATRDAGRIAGLEVLRIVNEPTAAALAYGIGLWDAHRAARAEARTVAVFDLGGGTFDISILRLTPAAQGETTDFFQVLSTAGDTRLGGDDVDHALVDLFLREANAEVARSGSPPLPIPPGAMQALISAAERVKCELSEREESRLQIDIAGHVLYSRSVSRAQLEALIEPWIARALEACARALRDARAALPPPAPHRPAGIDSVVMVGGSTRIPAVRRRVRDLFGVEPYIALDPDQVVALGAAVQGAILSGAVSGSLLLDVIPLSLGVETVGGAVAKLIMRNSTVPARATEMFSTSVDGQTSIKLHILQGEREMAADCRGLGEFHLRGLPPMPAGIPQVQVELLVDANGVLNVSAVERRSGRHAALQVVPNHGLTREEVDRMERESVAHAREDMTRHRIADLIANSRLDLKWIGERLESFGAALDAPLRDRLREHIERLGTLVERADADWRAVDADVLARAKDELDRASIRLQEIAITDSLRDQSRAAPNPPPAPASPPAKDAVEDR